MNFEYFLYQYLLKHNRAEVAGFGVFELTKQSAKIDSENSVIIPPKETISFNADGAADGSSLIGYIAAETNSDHQTVELKLENQIRIWNQVLERDKVLSLGHLGQYQVDENQKIVKANDADDLFGFEEINLQNLKNHKPKIKELSGDYKLNKNVLWTFFGLIVIGIAALFLFGDRELIFGKSSQIPAKKAARIIKATPAAPKQDTIKTDTINKPTTNAKIQKTNR